MSSNTQNTEAALTVPVDDVLRYELLESNGPKNAPTGDPVMSVRDLNVSFNTEAGTVHAVRGVNFDLWGGRTLGIVGESGSGKSVTALSLIGLLDDNAHVKGSIKLRGTELIGLTDEEMSQYRGANISMIFQDPLSALTPMFSIGDQLAEALKIHDPEMSKADVRARCIELLELVGIPEAEDRLDSYPHEFSGGMRQRVVIAIAIANNPDIIIADEPTTALDVTIQAQILDLLKVAQKETGAAVVLITHDLGVVAGIADDIMVMYAGRAVERASVDTLFARPGQPYTMGLFAAVPKPHMPSNTRLVPIKGNPPSLAAIPPGCPFSPRCPIAGPECFKTEPHLEALDPAEGHLVSCLKMQQIRDQHLTYKEVYPDLEPLTPKWAEVPRDERPVVLELKDVTKVFEVQSKGLIRRTKGTVTAMDKVSFQIHEGETLALVGESGSGKSTTLMEIMDLAVPKEGTITVLGKDTRDLKSARERRELRRDLQVIFQDPMMIFQDPMTSLNPVYTVGRQLGEGLRIHRGYSKKQALDRATELLSMVGIPNAEQRVKDYPHQFSGGMRQRAMIAMALACDPDILIADEPTTALDVTIQAQIIELMQEMQKKNGNAIIMITHDLGVVADDILIADEPTTALDVTIQAQIIELMQEMQKKNGNAIIMITHDLGVVADVADKIMVMYAGKPVEFGTADEIFYHPVHPYTWGLMRSIPEQVTNEKKPLTPIKGNPPSLVNVPEGCSFSPRCPYATELCRAEKPPVYTEPSGHYARCFYCNDPEFVAKNAPTTTRDVADGEPQAATGAAPQHAAGAADPKKEA